MSDRRIYMYYLYIVSFKKRYVLFIVYIPLWTVLLPATSKQPHLRIIFFPPSHSIVIPKNFCSYLFFYLSFMHVHAVVIFHLLTFSKEVFSIYSVLLLNNFLGLFGFFGFLAFISSQRRDKSQKVKKYFVFFKSHVANCNWIWHKASIGEWH